MLKSPLLSNYNSITEVFDEFQIPLVERETITIVSAVKSLQDNFIDLIFIEDNKLYLVVAFINETYMMPDYKRFLSKDERLLQSLLKNDFLLPQTRENLKIYFADLLIFI